uniref:Sai protein n=1 Tax=Fritillaria thunbergii TaxID=108546 RepID=A0A977TEH7_9LILI|nr:sai protein [Fritillaria thunbergii]
MKVRDLESSSSSVPLLYQEDESSSQIKILSTFLSAVTAAALLLLLVTLVLIEPDAGHRTPVVIFPASRGVSEGVSDKSTASLLGSSLTGYPWTKAILQWQRTGFHFQPEKNWMNDPDGPLFYKGWYHIFYQYNPDSAVWGNITWGHAVSRDLIHWLHLPLTLVPDHWYDANGVWTGSATFLPDGRIVMVYTGSTTELVQVQNLAYPADLDDPLLLNWLKSDANPVLLPPPGIGVKDFRDPTTAWYDAADAAWKLAIGSKDENHNGICLIYRTHDFIAYELLPGVLHSVPGTGMWECIDFYPVSTDSEVGLDTSVPPGPSVRHVLKASLDDDKHDYYAIGTYDLAAGQWVPDDAEADVGIGLRYDYGKYYASKTFFDTAKGRRVLWGWTGETDSERTDLLKGWASVMTIPRTVLFDQKTGSNLLQWPVEEVESLRLSSQDFKNIDIDIGSVVLLNISRTTQLDIFAEFEIEGESLIATVEADLGYNCSTSGGAAGRGVLGPFGFLVLSDEELSEQTAVCFYVVRNVDGELKTFFCQDELRSSKADDIVKRVYGSIVPVLSGEILTVRILVDHSIVESFAQGGRTCITSRIYPTKAIDGVAKLFLFNNGTGAKVTAKSIKIWQMNSAFIRPYPLEA